MEINITPKDVSLFRAEKDDIFQVSVEVGDKKPEEIRNLNVEMIRIFKGIFGNNKFFITHKKHGVQQLEITKFYNVTDKDVFHVMVKLSDIITDSAKEQYESEIKKSLAPARIVFFYEIANDDTLESPIIDTPSINKCYSDNGASIPWPDPTKEQLNSLWFNQIWDVIKDWNINVPNAYDGYCSATGNHVVAILNAISKPEVDHIDHIDHIEQWK